MDAAHEPHAPEHLPPFDRATWHRDDAVSQIARDCAHTLRALHLVAEADEGRARDVISAYMSNFGDRLTAGEWR